MIRARASSLPTAEHCTKLWAARHADQIGIRGYDLRKLKPHVGAAVGTSTHSAGEFLMREFQVTGQVGGAPRLRQARDCAMEALSKAADGNLSALTYDDTTPGPTAATEAVGKLVASYHANIDPDLPPLLIERGLTMVVGDDMIITGHVDLVLVDLQPEDLKTGRNAPRAASQYGAYFLLIRANADQIGIDQTQLKPKFRQRYMPRVRSGKPQPDPVVTEFPQGAVERQALSTARHIRRSVKEFQETGDPDSFLANPQTWLCSDKFCPAWGTRFCDAWRFSAAARKERT